MTSGLNEDWEMPEGPGEIPGDFEETPEDLPETDKSGPPVPTNAIELAGYLVRHCEKCPLSRTRTNAVPGEGPMDA